jgi:hypothetical protein
MLAYLKSIQRLMDCRRPVSCSVSRCLDVPSDQADNGGEGLAQAFETALTEATLQDHVIDDALRVRTISSVQKWIPYWPAAIKETAACLYRMPGRVRDHEAQAFHQPHGRSYRPPQPPLENMGG